MSAFAVQPAAVVAAMSPAEREEYSHRHHVWAVLRIKELESEVEELKREIERMRSEK